MRKFKLTFVLFLILTTSLYARKVDPATAKTVGINFLNEKFKSKGYKPISELKLIEERLNNSITSYYIFNSQNNGFVIISGDDAISPILGYSYENDFDIINIAPSTKALLDAYNKKIYSTASKKMVASSEIRAEWKNYLEASSIEPKGIIVEHLISTSWGQTGYYNDFCPGDAPAGCVAVAMAQIMRYWRYPEINEIIPGYTSENYGFLNEINPTKYNWCGMYTDCTISNSSTALLLYHCGVSVQMNYSESGSGAFVIEDDYYGTNEFCAENALQNSFGFQNTISGIRKNDFSESEWINIIKNELYLGRPVLYAGFTNYRGHAFVCDGYDSHNKFHFNWGWEGSDDGFYSINDLLGYDYLQQAVIGIKPNDDFSIYTNYNVDLITKRFVTGDFDNDGNEDDEVAITGVYNYAKINKWMSDGSSFDYFDFWNDWSSSTYIAANLVAVVVGDFDNDGFKDDIAGFYDYGNNLTKLHLWKSNGSTFSFSIPWTGTSYNAKNIEGKVVVGDFDRDGYEDDIAAFYYYGKNITKLHVWKSTGSSFVYTGDAGWWNSTSYIGTNITSKVTSGDYDRDGYKDDIAAFYYYGNNLTKLHIWKSTGSSFSISMPWIGTSYDGSLITGRVVSGDFDRDGYEDDIAAFYDYNKNITKIHVWNSNGIGFVYTGDAGWWSSPTYIASNITYRVTSGDYNSDSYKDNIAGFYDYGNGKSAIHVWNSNSNSFSYTGDVGWWISCDVSSSYAPISTNIEKYEDNVLKNNDINIYPNPSSGKFNISTSDYIKKIEIYNIVGTNIYNNTTINETTYNLDLSKFSKGMYFVKISTENKIFEKKIILK